MSSRAAACGRLTVLALTAVVAACSSTPPTAAGTPPPPPANNHPGSVVIQAGDGQQAAPGAVVPIRPTVVVKGSTGLPIAGITVTFSVDSGAGTVTGATVVTDANGVATLGSWTLGPTAGRNVLRVTVAGIPPVFVRVIAANPLVVLAQNVSIGPGGGAVSYTKAGDSLSGLTITIPPAAFPTATQWTVTAKAGVTVPLPPGVFIVGPMIGVTDGQAYSRGVMTLRIPLQVGSDTALAAFLYDSNTATLEMAPIVTRSATSITIATRHFSADRLLRPATAFPSGSRVPARGRPGTLAAALRTAPRSPVAASLFARPLAAMMRSQAPPPFGTVDIIIGGVNLAQLQALPITTSFAPGADDWEFPNYPTAAAPTGISAGMSISALYYNYAYSGPGPAPLNDLFNELQGCWQADPGGLRLGTQVQYGPDLDWAAMRPVFEGLHDIAASSNISYDVMEYESLLVAMIVTGRAQFFIAYQPGGAVHSMIAFAAQNGRINVADPNTPGTFATVTFAGGAFTPHLFSENVLAPAQSFSSFIVFGPTEILDEDALQNDFEQLANGTIGDGGFPDTWLEYYDYATQAWKSVPAHDDNVPGSDTLRIASDTFLVRTNCSNCAHQRAASDLPTRQYTEVVEEINNAPFSVANDRPDFTRGALVPMEPRTQTLGITSYAYTNLNAAGAVDWEFEFADFRRLVVVSGTYRITPAAASGPVDSTYEFAASGPDFGTGTTFSWTGTLGATSHTASYVDDPLFDVELGRPGVWKLKLLVYDPQHRQIGIDSTTVTVNPLQVRIDPSVYIVGAIPFAANPGDPVTFVATVTGFTPANVRYVWHFGDPGSVSLTTAVPTAIHTYTATSSAVGSFPVTVDLYDADNVLLGHAAASAQIKVWPPIWRITSFVRTRADNLPPGYAAQYPFQAVLDSIDLYMGKVLSVPTDGRILITDDSSYVEHSVVFTVSRVPNTGYLTTTWVYGDYFTLLARTCCDAGVVTDVGTSTDGTLTGWSSTTAFQGGQYNMISAIKGTTTSAGITTGTLTGTITIFSPGQPYGERIYQFTAIKVSP